MQTFLPYPDFGESAEVLDPVRLRNQRRECKSILTTLYTGEGWKHHPAVRMWAGHEGSLVRYSLAICDEVMARGWADEVHREFGTYWWNLYKHDLSPPLWLGWEPFHLSHRSNLLAKDYDYYRKYFSTVPDDLAYIWPTHYPELMSGEVCPTKITITWE